MTRGSLRPVLATAVGTLLLTSCTADGAESPSEGDLTVGIPDGAIIGYGVKADAGARVAFGSPTLKNFTDRPATVKGVVLHGEVSASAAEVVEVRVREYGQGGSNLHASPRWPMPRYVKTSEVLDDYVLQPGEVVTFLTVVDVLEDGFHHWPTMEFIYEQGSTTYTHSMDAVAFICPSNEGHLVESAEAKEHCGPYYAG